MNEVVIVGAVRSPIGRRNGSLSSIHAVDLLSQVLGDLFDRTGVAPGEVGQVIGGCVGQVGMQSMNVTRTAWLAAGLPIEVPGTTVDAQCGSSQQASTLAFSLIASGVVECAVACGVEVMSKVSLGATTPKEPDVGKPINRTYWKHHEFTSQFEGAERLAEQRGITRADTDAFGLQSQLRAARAVNEGRFVTQVVPIQVNVPDSGSTLTTQFVVDEALRDTSLDELATLKPTGREDGVHTAGTSSQIADGASAVLLMSRARAIALGLASLATIVDSCLVGCDPVVMLEGPIPATHKLLNAHGLRIDQFDLFEVNEAFAAVVLAWQKEFNADPDRVNPNGGAIALGHPLGATGTILLTKAVHELERADAELALVTMCCGGGLGTGTVLRRA